MMVGDADPYPNLGNTILLYSLWTYPVAVVIVAILRRKLPLIVLLPFVNIAGCIIPSIVHYMISR